LLLRETKQVAVYTCEVGTKQCKPGKEARLRLVLPKFKTTPPV